MKMNTVIAVASAMILGLASVSYGGYVSGFKVVGVSENQVTIQKGKHKPVEIPTGAKKFKVGDKVDFDAVKAKVRESIEGC